ncbi:DUF6456 domain-containing protein [Aestuariivita sp.]|uniref:DUF6456 domain-containing protein n=1 Tax=Aestuariivita sp. TaxID=1872407 RepID=UPI0025C6C051|nr:DUF6456 domain-containing protein [Aestuariivita sp.]
MKILADTNMPGWATDQSVRYLAHTVAGRSIRQLARIEDCHPSTILRQIRRVEMRRDDPLVDEALKSLGRCVVNRALNLADRKARATQERVSDMTSTDTIRIVETEELPSDATLAREAPRVLRRLCESGAVLALAADMDKAVVVRDAPGVAPARTAVVDRGVARAMALNEWIACQSQGRIARYTITQAGRGALNRMMAEAESRQVANPAGFAETAAGFTAAEPAGDISPAKRSRYAAAESPLSALARRKDRDGQPFLADSLVAAGERLREDFELSQLGPGTGQNWEKLLNGGVGGLVVGSGLPELGACSAQDRVLRALQELGPGLSDVALRCCCFLEGLEMAEKRMGWSARSGKIVLRIALQRLKRHYATLSRQDQMIG